VWKSLIPSGIAAAAGVEPGAEIEEAVTVERKISAVLGGPETSAGRECESDSLSWATGYNDELADAV
jgi:hypothetical protein